MSAPEAPKLDPRRTDEFFAELRDRARAWIPSWGFADNEGDFGGALLQIAARFNSEVAQRLDRAGEKMRRGFLDWLAVRGEAAHPSRMPVVFKLSDTATDAVLAKAPVQMQAPTANASVVFETETDINILPGSLQTSGRGRRRRALSAPAGFERPATARGAAHGVAAEELCRCRVYETAAGT